MVYEKTAQKPGTRTLLISPLVALARQQLVKLQSLQIPTHLGAGGNSKGPPDEQTGTWIISPEMLTFEAKRSQLKKWKPNFLVVDECHCLWEWGERFRPAFTLIPEILESQRIPKSLWLTATLPLEARLHLRQLLPSTLIELGSFDLPAGLSLHLQQVTWENRTQALISWIRRMHGKGMIFVPTRDATLRLARLTQAMGKNTVIYHAGMSSEERRNTEAQIADKIPDIIIATSAFGMGMDYSHLKYVILWQAPTSLLSLVQSVGRVGRSGSDSTAVVLWDYQDFKMLEWTLAGSEKRKKELLDLLSFLKTPECRRIALKRYFDPDLHQHERACQFCDYCSSDLPMGLSTVLSANLSTDLSPGAGLDPKRSWSSPSNPSALGSWPSPWP